MGLGSIILSPILREGDLASCQSLPRCYFRLLHGLLRRFGVPLSFYRDRHDVFVRNDDDLERRGRRVVIECGAGVALRLGWALVWNCDRSWGVRV